MKKTKYSSAYDHFLKELEVNYMVYAVFTEAAVNMLRIFSELLRRSTEQNKYWQKSFREALVSRWASLWAIPVIL